VKKVMSWDVDFVVSRGQKLSRALMRMIGINFNINVRSISSRRYIISVRTSQKTHYVSAKKNAI
jgi:aspartokinase